MLDLESLPLLEVDEAETWAASDICDAIVEYQSARSGLSKISSESGKRERAACFQKVATR